MEIGKETYAHNADAADASSDVDQEVVERKDDCGSMKKMILAILAFCCR